MIFLAISGIITYFYQDEVSLYLVEELNEQVSSNIEVGKVKFSVLKKFPKASIELEKVYASPPAGYFARVNQHPTDTLFYAQSIFIQFNLMDIFNRNYHITDIHLNRGDLRLLVDHLGEPNYIFWETPGENKKSEVSIDLKGVKITNSNLLYYNDITKTTLITSIDHLDFEGNFTHQNYLMKISTDMFVDQLAVEEIEYLEHKKVQADVKLNIVGEVNHIEDGLLTIEDLKFNISGDLHRGDSKKINIGVTGSHLPLKSVLKHLPSSVVKDFPAVQAQKGEVSVNLHIAGDDIRVDRPLIDADFKVENARIYDTRRGLEIQDFNAEGSFTNGEQKDPASTHIDFKNVKAILGSSKLKGQVALTNLYDPSVKMELFAELNFEDIHRFFSKDTFALLKGFAETHLKFHGKYAALQQLKFSDLFTSSYSVDLTLADAAFQYKGNPVRLEDINGNIELNRNLKAENLTFRIGDNDFIIDGYISKLYDYFQHQKMFHVNARLSSHYINLDQLSTLIKKKDKDHEAMVYRLPERLALSLKLDIRNFEVGKFMAQNIRGDLNYKPRMISLHQISFNSMDGYVKAGGVITQKYNHDFLVHMQSRLNEINIQKLFRSFNNFGQNFISNQNLKGSLTGEVFFSSEWNDRLKIDKKTVLSENDITLTNGELIDFEPMSGLSKFIDVQELRHIKFSTLKNQITIKDEKVFIPQMDIESSAINIAASGIHGFSNDFSYRLKVLLSDVISGRLKRSVRRHSEYENIEDDGLGRTTLFLLIEGNPDDYKVKYDRKAAREELKQNIQQERTTLKKIFREEFGWGNTDTTGEKSNEGSASESFEIKWEEEQEKTTGENETINHSEQKFIIEFEEDTIQ
jgi:hypothetical protein